MKVKRQKTIDMSCAAVDVKPRNVDWSTVDWFASDDRNALFEAVRCQECNKRVVFVNGGGGEPHNDVVGAIKSRCAGHVPSADGPMMNYWYPLGYEIDDAKAQELAKKIVDLPLCVVKLNDEYGLALTGGGMDLSWQICEAYMRIGSLPPTHFTPPAMCGRGTSKVDRWIVRGYLRSCRIAAGWAKRSAERAREAVAFGEKYEAERKAESSAHQ